MEKTKFGLLGFCIIALLKGIEGSHGAEKLFVFGDSYADTGNYNKSVAASWKQPYGITFPGKPAGRWSDGRILTDFLALLLGKRLPVPYRLRKESKEMVKRGVNFAYGGTGVFDTTVSAPNLTTQIDLFQSLVSRGTFSNITNSIALVSVAGNDYTTFQARNGTSGIRAFMVLLINQLAYDIKRIQAIGVPKIVVTSLPPLGCFPPNTVASAYTECNETANQLSSFHNLLLNRTVNEINNSSSPKGQKVVVLDLYKAFLSSIQGTETGEVLFKQNLRPCCSGLSSGDSCGSVDEKGNKRYTVCEKPTLSFFWDRAHPSQTGWASMLPHLQATLAQLY